MKIKKAHCMFEQSGTFKNAFRSLGIPAEDYDILDDFGEADNMIDLFREIDTAYEGGAERIRPDRRRGDHHGIFPMRAL